MPFHAFSIQEMPQLWPLSGHAMGNNNNNNNNNDHYHTTASQERKKRELESALQVESGSTKLHHRREKRAATGDIRQLVTQVSVWMWMVMYMCMCM